MIHFIKNDIDHKYILAGISEYCYEHILCHINCNFIF